MSDDMIERIAFELARLQGWTHPQPLSRHYEHARAILVAMREPTEAMETAGVLPAM